MLHILILCAGESLRFGIYWVLLTVGVETKHCFQCFDSSFVLVFCWGFFF
ncbi:hypothetical protein RchiOBHm_Chr3g0458921 [Rosa chinensis]|uniref:Uncharacterized protein n=1 Tax=Rosa chinensis TaxID=74649 RepID=A0A2P6R7Y9_ROSCH|nr:hypothetical protein RchiOBHm_Chr3g0458921 [Rosa chinensis]